jgi:hypothetical protein
VLSLLVMGQSNLGVGPGGFHRRMDGALTIVTQGPASGNGPSLSLKQSPIQVEDPSIIYEVEFASTARGEGILPPGIVASGKRR